MKSNNFRKVGNLKIIDLSTKILYIKQYLFNEESQLSILFLHGGPGSNSSTVEHFILEHQYFYDLKYNLVIYDQRGCGKSKSIDNVSHDDNVNDLTDIILHLKKSGIVLKAIIGHSYGAKVLCDYSIKNNSKLPCVFVGIADDMMTPRINNLILDLNYLKISHPNKYQELFNEFSLNDVNELWQLTEKLSDVFNQNPNRAFYYWANLATYGLFKNSQKNNNLPLSTNVFESVRKSLYLSGSTKLEFQKLNAQYMVINGFHDYVMNGYLDIFKNLNNSKVFDKSSHSPHLEENVKFCETINHFV